MMATKKPLARTIWDRTRAIDLSLVGVLTLAACLRWVYIGMYQLVGDEAILLYSALRLGRHGQWTWLTLNVTSWSFLPGHSPFSVYLIAIPYLFSPDPRLARLWVGLLAIVGIAVMYWVMRRYFGQTAALMTG